MRHNTQKGFTMVEMITVVGIFMILSAIVIFNYNKFRSDTILTNMAYEVALSIREAQIYGVSARGGAGDSTDFSVPYGVYLPVGSSQYFVFADTGNGTAGTGDGNFSGTDCNTDNGGDTCTTPYTLQRNVKIGAVHARTGSACHPDIEGLSIVFRRPNPEPVITKKDGSPAPDAISIGQITITAPDGTSRFVTVYNNGQIGVVNQSICGS